MSFSPGKNTNLIASLFRTGKKSWFGCIGEASQSAQMPTIDNGEFVTAINAANTGVVNIIGVDANNNVVFADGSTVSSATVSLTAANIIAMNGAAVAILPAPGAGKAIVVKQILFEMTRTSTAFTGGGTVEFDYHGSTVSHTGTIAAAVVTGGAGSQNVVLGNASSTALTVPANLGIDITNGTAAFAAGTGTAKVQIWYSIVTL